MPVVVAIDAGTTGVRSMAFADDGQLVASRYRELTQYFPRPGWVEHDPDEIWASVAGTLAELLAGGIGPVAAIGITNQRETAILWDRRTGRPLHRAVVWQDRRTTDACRQLQARDVLPLVRERTGLVLDPYFSATKVAWMLGEGGVEVTPDTAFGTVDSWVLWNLSGGAVHATDPSNASRTLLFDTARLAWDEELADLFGVPVSLLPDLAPTSGVVAETATGAGTRLPGGVPIGALVGDQQAALFGQACFEAGMTKNTYGTGSFVLMNAGADRPPAVEGLLTSVAWSLGEVSPAATAYALEGSVFVTGAALQWLRDGLGLVSEAAEAGPLAQLVPDTGGAVFVPALTGLGSPWWDPDARGTVVGLSRGVGRAHLVRAAVEAMAYQSADVLEAMTAATGRKPSELRVDGGASAMDFLLRFQADLLGVPVRRAALTDVTALGAAFLAGLATGVWSSTSELADAWSCDAEAEPDADAAEAAAAGYGAWRRAVSRARSGA